MWWACRVVRQQRAVATAAAAAAALSTSANTCTRWTPDTSLVRLPANVQHCAVYRNVVSLDDEQKLYAELSYVLQQDGHVTYAATTTLPVHTSSSSSSSSPDEQQQQHEHDDDDDGAADDKADKDSTRNNSHTTSSHATRPVRHTYVELYGNEKPYVEARTFTRQDTRRVPGLVWSPTLMRVLRSLPLHIRQRVCSGGNAGTTTRRDGQQRQTLSRDADAVTTTANNNSGGDDDTNDAFTLDMARVVEHQLPGYEMHIEPPTVGSGFVYLNLLSDTVLEFDDEATRRHGQVYVPARALLVVAGEARWGMRFGEATTTPHIFAGRRRVEADMRLSVQAWRAHLGMLDARVLQDEVARCVAAHEARQRQRAQRASQKKTQQQHEGGQGDNNNDSSSGDRCCAKDVSASASASAAAATSSGPLGGDLTGAAVGGGATRAGVTAKPQDIARDYAAYRKQFMKAYAAMRELQSATATHGGKPVDEMQLYRKLADMTRHDDNDNDDNDTDGGEQASVCADGVNDGFDANDLEGTWERIADKAAVYKEKLRTMDYDKTAFAHSTLPPVGQREPLDMRGTLRDIAPYIKDGEKMLASLPPKPPTMPFD